MVATTGRLRLLGTTLSVTAVATAVGGVLWPRTSGGGETYSYADIAAGRELWWGLLGALAVIGILTVTTQALTAMILVRERGGTWVTAGGAAMWLGISMQAVGVAGWASAYFYATDSSVDPAHGAAVVEAANADQAHLFGFLVPGALLVLSGTVLQCVGLIRSRFVAPWVPVALLFSVLTLVVPGDGALGLVTSVPMAAGAIGLALAVTQRRVDSDAEDIPSLAGPELTNY